tara:strand:+ start:2864 stop:3529 length:666 start_codon:yes stop_codon:yes gene_type:complete
MDDLTLDGLKNLKRRVDEESDKKDEKIKNLEGLVKQIVACADQVKLDYQQKLETIQVENLQLKEEIEKLKKIIWESNNNNNNSNNNNDNDNDIGTISLYEEDKGARFRNGVYYTTANQKRIKGIKNIKFAKDNDNQKIIDEAACQLNFYDKQNKERLTGFYELAKSVKFNDYQISAIRVKQRLHTLNFPALERRNGDNYCTYCGKKIKTGDEHDTLCELRK